MSILITKNGLLDTLQDDGRYGYQHLGVNPGGAMDLVALSVANSLVGNAPGEAILEMHFPAAEMRFGHAALIAISGGDFDAQIDGRSIPILSPVWVPAGAQLKFDSQKKGMRSYLAVQGGFQTDSWLGSSSTHLKVKAGGFHGKALQKGDSILFRQIAALTSNGCTILPWNARVSDLYNEGVFHFIPGNEYWLLDEASRKKIETGIFQAGPQSDRMGYRIKGDVLQVSSQAELISTAVTRGTIQLLPNGQLIILMADHQTTGGYPRIGHIISADLPSLAQTPPSHNFTLKKVTIETAERRFLAQQSNLRQLQNACNFRLQQYQNKQ